MEEKKEKVKITDLGTVIVNKPDEYWLTLLMLVQGSWRYHQEGEKVYVLLLANQEYLGRLIISLEEWKVITDKYQLEGIVTILALPVPEWKYTTMEGEEVVPFRIAEEYRGQVDLVAIERQIAKLAVEMGLKRRANAVLN